MLLDALRARLGLSSCWTRAGFLGVALTCVASSNLAQKQPEATQGPSVASRAPESGAPAGEFAGPERCVSCHKEVAAEYGKTTHSKLVFPKKEYIHGWKSVMVQRRHTPTPFRPRMATMPPPPKL
jgi:hypothetical protein